MSVTSAIGQVMSGVADNGDEPVKIGGIYSATPSTLTTGQRGAAQLAARGGLAIAAFNGTLFEDFRNTLDLGTLINAVGATTSQNSPDQTNYNHRGVIVFWNVTSAGTGSVTISVQVKDSVASGYINISAFTAVTTTGLKAYVVYPSVTTAAANTESTNWVLPRTFRVVANANNVNPMTYTVGASLIL